MATTAGVNVLRYSALGAGVIYGWYHQRSITTSQKAAAAKRDYEHRQDLIEQARKEYAKSKQPVVSVSTSGGVIKDPMDPKFDMEAYMNDLVKASP